MNTPPFIVGQQVIAIINHNQGLFMQRDIRTVLGVKQNKCCGVWGIDIGIKVSYAKAICVCGQIYNYDPFIHVDYFKLYTPPTFKEKIKLLFK